MDNNDLSRRRLLGAGAVGAAAFGIAGAEERRPTAGQTEGPFYPVTEQADKDADLTTFNGGKARGEPVSVEGRVLDEEGAPIAGAVVDIWQANAAGRYSHEADPNPAPLDPHFQGWAIVTTDEAGRYRFRTVKPGAYPATEGWSRPPHIHFKVARRGYREITTQMYFPGEPLNEADRILAALPAADRANVIARKGEDGAMTFDVVLAKV